MPMIVPRVQRYCFQQVVETSCLVKTRIFGIRNFLMKEKKNISILVTGAGGQLGQELSIASKSFLQFRYQFADRSVLDISDKDALKDFFEKKQPDVVINCAAYTNVEKAEDEPHQAILYNATSVGYLADL